MLTRRNMMQAMLAAGAAPPVLRGAGRRAGEKPNLLFIWTDEQRADTLAVNGNRTFHIPALNRLAAESVSFSRCYDTQPVCTPARGSVMTGLWPHTAGTTTNNVALPATTPTMPELLADSSYRTGYMGKWHLGDEIFAQHGFETWVSIEDAYNKYYSASRDKNKRSDYQQFLVQLGYKPKDNDQFSRSIVGKVPIDHTKPGFLASEASNFISKHRQEPWMLYVNFLEPHMPFTGPYNDLHTAEEAPLPKNYPHQPMEREPEVYQRAREKFREDGFEGHDLSTRQGWEEINRNYAGLCTLVDHAVNRILWALESSGQAGNTIVVFTSDHGDMMGSHSLLTKNVMYEEAVRIPLLVRVPFQAQKPHRIELPVSHIDLVPTLLDLMGRKAPESLPGQSLVPLLRGGVLRQDHVFIEWNAREPNTNVRTIISPDGFKLAMFDRDNCLLFDRSRDPQEMRNIYYRSESAPASKRLRAKLEKWQRDTRDKMALPS